MAACLERLAAGDLTARNQIIEMCSDRLRILTSRMLAGFPNVRRWDDTDDVFQNAMMRLYRSLGQLPIDSPRAVMGLAAKEVGRALLDLARTHAGPQSFAANHATNHPAGHAPDDSSVPPFLATVSAPDERLDRWTAFQEAIQALPDDAREVFCLVWYLDADQASIATLIGCSERTVRSRWQTARLSVRAALDGIPPA
jgi:RNA polymerase sigma-70 factor (ECF subfamily)